MLLCVMISSARKVSKNWDSLRDAGCSGWCWRQPGDRLIDEVWDRWGEGYATKHKILDRCMDEADHLALIININDLTKDLASYYPWLQRECIRVELEAFRLDINSVFKLHYGQRASSVYVFHHNCVLAGCSIFSYCKKPLISVKAIRNIIKPTLYLFDHCTLF